MPPPVHASEASRARRLIGASRAPCYPAPMNSLARLCLCALLVAGCEDTASGDSDLNDMRVSPDAGSISDSDVTVDLSTIPDSGGPQDAGPTVDAEALDASADSAAPDAGLDLQTTDMTARFGAVTEPFTLAYFGRNMDGSFHVEIYGDPAEQACPSMNSPAPGRSLILAGFASPVAAEHPLGSAVLFDFSGTLTDMLLLRFERGTQNGLSWSLDGDAADEMNVEVDITFPGGTVTGRFYATHCQSLDGE